MGILNDISKKAQEYADFSAEIFEACEKEQNIHDLLGGICRRSCFIFLCTGFPGCGQCD